MSNARLDAAAEATTWKFSNARPWPLRLAKSAMPQTVVATAPARRRSPGRSRQLRRSAVSGRTAAPGKRPRCGRAASRLIDWVRSGRAQARTEAPHGPGASRPLPRVSSSRTSRATGIPVRPRSKRSPEVPVLVISAGIRRSLLPRLGDRGPSGSSRQSWDERVDQSRRRRNNAFVQQVSCRRSEAGPYCGLRTASLEVPGPVRASRRMGQPTTGLRLGHDAYWAVQPPSTGKIAPVISPDARDARKTTAAATSAVVPTRPTGIRSKTPARKVASSSLSAVPGV